MLHPSEQRVPMSQEIESARKIRSALKQYWGFHAFRPLQEEIIGAILTEKDVLAVLPTGAGKSLCYQLPALIREGLTLVVSPLIALMNDQVRQLQKRGIKAAAVHSQMPWLDVQSQLNRAHHGQLDLLYVSPERFTSERFLTQIADTAVAGAVIDEAHCISMWGYDFRPSYLALSEIRRWFPELQIVATTATATPAVVKDIQEKLELKEPHVFQASVLRPNLRFGVWRPDDKMASVLQLLKQVSGPTIIYVGRRRTAHEIERVLARRDINVAAYHAGLDKDKRNEIEDDFIRGDRRVMVATNAFGMGIDKSDVRMVIHYDLPSNLESYYQEAGRAGRDGEAAYAVALYAPVDMEIMEAQLVREFPPEKYIRKVYDALGNFLKLAIGSGLEQTFSFDFNAFCKRYSFEKTEARSAIKVLQQSEWLVLEEGSDRARCTVHFVIEASAIYDYRTSHPERDRLINALLRMHEGILFHPTMIDVGRLSHLLDDDEEDIERRLRQLDRAGIIDYREQDDLPQLTLLRERVSAKNLIIDRQQYEFRKERRLAALQAMQKYLTELVCRQQEVARYFGQVLPDPCGQCDLCRQRARPARSNEAGLRTSVIQHLQENRCTLDELIGRYEFDDHPAVIDILQDLVDEEQVIHEPPYFLRT
ncbi:MAG: RecQ family ATP-dependent DNA helicase [Saprospiraceae bacterium]|nr:RecQ family ATP-dependent DNA helicase [Saprospiraceae bacterium]